MKALSFIMILNAIIDEISNTPSQTKHRCQLFIYKRQCNHALKCVHIITCATMRPQCAFVLQMQVNAYDIGRSIYMFLIYICLYEWTQMHSMCLYQQEIDNFNTYIDKFNNKRHQMIDYDIFYEGKAMHPICSYFFISYHILLIQYALQV